MAAARVLHSVIREEWWCAPWVAQRVRVEGVAQRVSVQRAVPHEGTGHRSEGVNMNENHSRSELDQESILDQINPVKFSAKQLERSQGKYI